MTRRFIILASTLAMLACSDSFSPSTQSIAGTYSATTLTSTTGGVSTNQLAAGATMTLTLTSDGTTTGQLSVPGGGEDGGDLTASLASTWTLAGDQVSFAQSADTFVRDMAFTATHDRLRGDATFTGTRIQVTLQRSGT